METMRVRLRVSPGPARAAVVGRYGDGWKLRVPAPPEGGRANEATLRLLANALALPRASLTLVAGHTSRDKIVELAGMSPAQTEALLASAGRKDRRR